MKEPVLVTGGAGFLGSRLVRRLAADGHAVRVLDPAAEAAHLPAEVEIRRGSILDAEALDAAMAGVGTVFHLAAVATLWAPDPALYDRVNHQGTRAVLATARRARVGRIVVTSTALILRGWNDPNPKPISESDPLPPLEAMPGPYSRSKWRAAAAVRQAVDEGVDAVLLHPTVPIGAPGRFVTEPTEMLKSFLGAPPPAYLETRLNLVDADDVAAAHILAAETAPAGARYVLAGEDIAFSELLEALTGISGRSMPQRRIPYAIAASAAHCGEWIARLTGRPPAASIEGVRAAKFARSIDGNRARDALGWHPKPARTALEAAARAIVKGGR